MLPLVALTGERRSKQTLAKHKETINNTFAEDSSLKGKLLLPRMRFFSYMNFWEQYGVSSASESFDRRKADSDSSHRDSSDNSRVRVRDNEQEQKKFTKMRVLPAGTASHRSRGSGGGRRLMLTDGDGGSCARDRLRSSRRTECRRGDYDRRDDDDDDVDDSNRRRRRRREVSGEEEGQLESKRRRRTSSVAPNATPKKTMTAVRSQPRSSPPGHRADSPRASRSGKTSTSAPAAARRRTTTKAPEKQPKDKQLRFAPALKRGGSLDFISIDDETQPATAADLSATAFMRAKDSVESELVTELASITLKGYVGTLLKDALKKLKPDEIKVLNQQGNDAVNSIKVLSSKVQAIQSAKAGTPSYIPP